MLKKILGVVLLVGLVAGGAVFMLWQVIQKDENTMTEVKEQAPAEVASEPEVKVDSAEEKIKAILARMSLEQKVGQMIIVRNNYQEMTEELRAELQEIQPGGYTIFSENITTLAGTRELIHETRAEIEKASAVTLADGTTETVSAIMSVDQEGGLVQRLQAILDYPPEYVGAMALVQTREEAYNIGKLLGEECASVGLNVDFAPVADIFSNPQNTVIGERAFGTDKETVATLATAAAKGLSEAGVVPTYKHFPGHGDTLVDSHQALPVVTKTLAELEENELYPFREVIKAGAEMIMVAHIALPNVTGDYTPASLSPKMLDILRNDLGYSGIIITDGLDMGALTANYTNAEIAVKAVAAGADILLTPVSPAETKAAILSAVADGTLSEERINESLLRILELKLRRFSV